MRQNFSGQSVATSRYASSSRAMTPTMMFSMGFLQMFAEADVKSPGNEKARYQSEVNEVAHGQSGFLFDRSRRPAVKFDTTMEPAAGGR
jgi:hypothetical protein